ncbi:hypothetical protein BU15DRAFT_60244 [Melanogaster broomeanus]|nr:hypothetical protein BU15DRAFT_60244 [Melanogaster broomeanus]
MRQQSLALHIEAFCLLPFLHPRASLSLLSSLPAADPTNIAKAIRLCPGLVKDGVVDEHASPVPWTIVNKYYTADVQFVIHQLSTWVSNEDELQAPAILFIWTDGEPYREQLHTLSQQLLPHDFEVALAIRLPRTDPSSPVDIEDDQDIDGYLSSKGFEFVDVPDSTTTSPVWDRSGIPGVPRIIDALSTIMWPSMTASETDTNRVQRELEELERWLEEDTGLTDADARSSDEEYGADPWSKAITSGTTTSHASSDDIKNSRSNTPKAGFDDDFAAFVSASPSSSAGVPQVSSESSSPPRRFPPLASTSFSSTFSFDTISPGRSTPTFDNFDTSHLAPDDTAFGVSYRSLGSVSDFGDMDKETSSREHSFDSGDDDGDEDMPSAAEIAETSRRIFGSFPLSLSPTQEQGTRASDDDLSAEMTEADFERFDLHSVLGRRFVPDILVASKYLLQEIIIAGNVLLIPRLQFVMSGIKYDSDSEQ